MKTQFYFFVLLLFLNKTIAQNYERLPDPHNHIVPVHQMPWKTDMAPEAVLTFLKNKPLDISDSVISPNGNWMAFLFSVEEELSRFGLLQINRGEYFQLVNLPLPHRPIKDIVWIDNDLVAFDRWSQPHYGMHYVVDVKKSRLVLAAPFPDEFFIEQQRDTIP